ncbi:Rieske 2Fe-2S domain-containing protein [Paraburkholderia pallida]|uniref:2Fe-2S iron-sulfur cluster binding domain-containing protein n=1 Tax=Paraburkholderia pallida TaxID=2547399 RepID=A0A4P7CY50_9BURK|nr:Rieske 2Fe-2S domain-containing protein [Paraburkholderia pallida]QBR01221.1 2Fe-2S iron-sulfur cluster binding domain-containing protein [Paraburkholderia pallida]
MDQTTTSLPSGWHMVGRATDVPLRHVFHTQLHGVELALWRADDGAVNAWENRCPHRSVRFTLGTNTGATLRCQYHGWQYRAGDGRCTRIPASLQGQPPASLCARTFPIAEQDACLWVNLDATANDGFADAHDDPAAPGVPLRSLPFDAPLDAVADALASYALADAKAMPGSARALRRGDRFDIAWQSADGAHSVQFWLQPATAVRTVVHGNAALNGAANINLPRFHNRLLSALRRTVERNTQTPASLRSQRIIPISVRSNTADNAKRWLRATVLRREVTAQDIVAFELSAPEIASLPMEPGAHIDVQTPAGCVRQYSLVNAPGERERFVIGVKRESASRGGSRSLHDALEVGATILVSPPKAHFRLVEGAPAVLIAGGIGITPILAMASALQHAGVPYRLHNFVRSREHLAFASRLAGLSHVQLHTGLDTARTAEAARHALRDAMAGAHVYVCGPRPLIDLARENAHAMGFPDSHVHFELFANEVSHAGDQPFRVRLQRSGEEFVVPAGVSLADAIQARGVAVPTSCEQGVCGTCRVGIAQGEPEHRDVYLSSEEKERGHCLLACVSRSRSDLLILDL